MPVSLHRPMQSASWSNHHMALLSLSRLKSFPMYLCNPSGGGGNVSWIDILMMSMLVGYS